jgi:hypothetical protein
MEVSFRKVALIAAMWPSLAGAADVELGPPANAVAEPWQAVFNAEARYISWNSSGGNSGITPGVGQGGGSGQQLYLPVALQITGRPAQDLKLEMFVRGGEIWTRQSTGNGFVEFSGPTDTIVGFTSTYQGWAGVQPFVALNVNLPTGRTIINGSSSNSKMDSELVPTPVFGEGLNVGPTVGANYLINESLIASLGVGYTNRGTYQRVFDPANPATGTMPYNPGDVLTGNGSLAYQGDRGTVLFSASYSTESTTQMNGVPFYRAGDRIILSAKGGYAWSDVWSSRLIVAYSHAAKDSVLSPGGTSLVRERANSNGDVYRVSTDTTYNREAYSIGPTASLLFRAANGYESTAPEFQPQRLGWSAGIIASYRTGPQTSVNARVEYLWARQSNNPTDFAPMPIFGSAIPPVLTTGWLGSIAGVIRF